MDFDGFLLIAELGPLGCFVNVVETKPWLRVHCALLPILCKLWDVDSISCVFNILGAAQRHDR